MPVTAKPLENPPLAEVIARRAVLLDGAMGTMLYERGVFITQCFEQQNLLKPHLVREVHANYVRAGAEIIESNTFGANRLKLARHGVAPSQMREIIQAGVGLAREAAAGARVWVAGSMGPTGARLQPSGGLEAAGATIGEPIDDAEALDIFREHAALLAEAGVELIILETFRDFRELELALAALRESAPALPVVALLTPNSQGQTSDGHSCEAIARRLETLQRAGAIAAGGFNDGAGPDGMFRLMQRMRRAAPALTLAAQPFIGGAETIEDRTIHLATSEFAAVYARRMQREGVRLIGLCCGGTPAHIRAMRNALRALQAGESPTIVSTAIASHAVAEVSISEPEEAPAGPPEHAPAATRFGAKIEAGKFAVSVEIDPPHGTDPAKALENVRLLALSGVVDAVNIADGPRATARMGPAALGQLIQRDYGIEAICHVCCRDRNLLGLQADLIGYNALGLLNVLCVTGDPPKMGDYPDATAVFDVDAIGLLGIVTRLNRGEDLAGNPIGPATRLFQGCGANPGAQNLEVEIDRLRRKRDAGARYVLTQPVYDQAIFDRFIELAAPLGMPILIGILPIASLRNALFLHNEVPGMAIPRPILERMERAPAGPEARAIGVEIAREALALARPQVQGTYIMPPFGSARAALDVLEALK